MRLTIAASALFLASPALPGVAGGCPHSNWRGQYQNFDATRCFNDRYNDYYGRHEAIARHERAQQQRGIDQSRAAGNVGPQN